MPHPTSTELLPDVIKTAISGELLGRQGKYRTTTEIRCLCPFHTENNPSFDYNTESGAYLCRSCGAKGRSWRFLVDKLNQTGANISVSSLNGVHGKDRILRVHQYRNRDGSRAYDVCRLDTEKSDAKYKPRLPDDGTNWGLAEDIPRVLYRLPELVAALSDQWILITEGEFDADNAAKAGYVATTNVSGAKGWKKYAKSYVADLEGRRVLLVADHDADGYKRIPEVWKTLKGRVSECRVLTFAHLPGFPEKGDLTDYLNLPGITVADLQAEIDRAPTAEEWIVQQEGPLPEGMPDFPCTVDGNALRLYHYFGEDLRYCPDDDEQFRIWKDPVWKVSKGSALIARARKLPGKILEEAAHPKIPGERKPTLKGWSVTSQGTKVITGAITLLRGEERLWTEAKQFDQQPYLLAMQNGVYDLETGTFYERGQRDSYLTLQSPVVFDPTATCPDWDKHLDFAFHGHPQKEAMIAYIDRVMFYSLTGSIRHKCFFFFHGLTNSGKSTIQGILHALLGPLAVNIRKELLIETKHQSHQQIVARLEKRRVGTAAEPKEHEHWNTEWIKEATGGDMMSANEMRQGDKDFSLVLKLFVSGNAEPQLRGFDPAFIGRMRLVHFPNQWATPDMEYIDRTLKPQLAGIFNRIVRSRSEWQEGGLNEPQSVIDAVLKYQEEQDDFGRFLRERFVIVPDSGEVRTTARNVGRIYNQWADEENIPTNRRMGKKMLGMRLKQRKGLWSKHTGGETWWYGLGVRSEAVEVAQIVRGGRRAEPDDQLHLSS